MYPSCLIFIQISYLNEIFKDKNISIYNVKEIFILCETIFLMYSKYDILVCVWGESYLVHVRNEEHPILFLFFLGASQLSDSIRLQ